MIRLENNHGLFVIADEKKLRDLDSLMYRYYAASIIHIRQQVTDAMGYSWDYSMGDTPLDDIETRFELFIMWVETGNYVL